MVYFNCRITIGKYLFRTFHSVEITESWHSIGDTAVLKMPGLKRKLEEVINSGDQVLIEMGYNGDLFKEFEGYVAEISPNIPFELRCEDESYKLKREQVAAKAWKSVQLSEVLKYVLGSNSNIQLEVPSITLAPFRLDKMSKYKALQEIKDAFGLTVYFRGKKLFVGLAYTEKNTAEKVVYHLQKNVPANQSDLTYKLKRDVKVKVKAISLLPNNTKITAEIGDDDGDSTTLHFYNITSETALKKMATEQLSKLKYEGYRGSLTAFGYPRAQHGQVAVIKDDDYPQRQASVFIDEVVKKVSKSGGYRREIKFGRRAE